MAKKIQVTQRQAEQFNRMLATLRKISKEYMTTEQLQKQSEKEYGLGFEECIEMVYENIQEDARLGCAGVRPIELPKPDAQPVSDTTVFG